MRYEADIYARYGGHRGFASGLAQASDPARPAPLLASEDARSSFFPPIDGVETNEGRSRGGWPKASRVGFSETEVALHPARRSLRSRCATPGSSLAIDPTKIGVRMKITDVVGPYAITAKSGCAVIASASEAIHGATEKWISSSRSLLAMTLRIVQAHTCLFFAINTHTSAISPRSAREFCRS